MPLPYLTKTDFKNAFECSTKLYYRKNSYPTTLEENDYMKFLSDSGFMVEFIAKAQFPSGHDLTKEIHPQLAFDRTKELLLADENAVLFEAAALAGKYYARIDILRREGKTLHLVEVKSSSIDDSEEGEERFLSEKGEIMTEWKPYLVDVAYQRHVLSLAFPGFEVKPWLWVVNKRQPVRESETRGLFHIKRSAVGSKGRPEIHYMGNRHDLQGTQLLARCEVAQETNLLMKQVTHRAEELASMLDDKGHIQRPSTSISELYKVCRKCEYRFPEGRQKEPNGFAECWGDLASASPHILNLYEVTRIGGKNIEDPVPVLLSQRKASLLDLKEEQLGVQGKRRERRLLQWKHSANGGVEYLPDNLRNELHSYEKNPGRPFHFVDFEACDVVLPHHAGLRPYERLAFQWSCHTLDAQNELTHLEWLNTARSFPNFTFARQLRACIGETGTVFVWSHYEQTTLRKILNQINEWIEAALPEALRASGFASADELRDLADWIKRLLGPRDANGKPHSSPRIRDLHKLAEQHYFHPVMRGRTSIKVVLPAVWQHSEAMRHHPWFSCYHHLDESGQPLDPYKTLEPLPLGGDEGQGDEDVVREGTGAIRVYQELIFCEGIDEQHRENREKLLKQYCKLDTAAMVMIWAHWTGHTEAANQQIHP